MTNRDERLRILKLVETGKISSEEASDLLAALGEEREVAVDKPSEGGAVRITVKERDRTKVNLNIPLSFVDFGLSMCQKFVPATTAKGVDFDEIREQVKTGLKGQLLEVHDEDDDVHVLIEVV